MTYTTKTPTVFRYLPWKCRELKGVQTDLPMATWFALMMYQLGRLLSKWFLERNPEVSAVNGRFWPYFGTCFRTKVTKGLGEKQPGDAWGWMMLKSPVNVSEIQLQKAIDTVWWKKSGDHQLRLVVFPMIYKVFVHARWLFGISSINSMKRRKPWFEYESLPQVVPAPLGFLSKFIKNNRLAAMIPLFGEHGCVSKLGGSKNRWKSRVQNFRHTSTVVDVGRCCWWLHLVLPLLLGVPMFTVSVPLHPTPDLQQRALQCEFSNNLRIIYPPVN